MSVETLLGMGMSIGIIMYDKFNFIFEHLPFGIGTVYKCFKIVDIGMNNLANDSYIIALYKTFEQADMIEQLPSIVQLIFFGLFVVIISEKIYFSINIKHEFLKKVLDFINGPIIVFSLELLMFFAILMRVIMHGPSLMLLESAKDYIF